jgi:transcriptional regulator with XRE-family HTH domain
MPDTLGSRIADIRADRRLTQAQLATMAGVSIDLIRKVEQGARQAMRLDNLNLIAQALDVPVARLIGKPEGLSGPTEDARVLTLRRALLAPVGLAGDPADVAELKTSVAGLWETYWRARYPALVAALPAAIGSVRGRVRAAVGDTERRAAHRQLAEVMQVTAATLTHLACEDLAHYALAEAMRAADEVSDPVLRGAIRAAQTWVLARQGLWVEAERLSIAAAAEVQPSLASATPDELAVWGELLRYGTTALARDHRVSEARELQGMVENAAAVMGSRRANLGGLAPFGSVIAGMAAVGIAVATEEPREALDLAARVGDIGSAPPSVQGRYLLNVAYAQTMDWHNLAAVDTLTKVGMIAPEVLRQQTIARAVVGELWGRRSQQRLPGLVALARTVGIETE